MHNGASYTQIVYGPGGGKLALMNGQNLVKALVPLGAGATAVYNSSGLAYYRYPDWLGSSRLASTPSRTVYYAGAYSPYGDNYAEAGTTDRNFTGQNQDLLGSGTYPLYDFRAREYHPTWGRWLTPDPGGLAAVDLTNPQSLNRYAYALNNPTTLTDPRGLSAQTCGHGFEVPLGQNPMTWCYSHMGIGEGSSPAAFFNSGTNGIAIAGNDIFDAIAGNPGTYLTLDAHGNLGFGFSDQLWSKTLNVLDAIRSGGSLPFNLPGIGQIGWTSIKFGVATSGFVVVQYDNGVSTDVSGVIPDLYAAAEAFNEFSASNHEALQNFSNVAALFGPATAEQAFPKLAQALQAQLGQLGSAVSAIAPLLTWGTPVFIPSTLSMPPAPSFPLPPLPPPPH